ncbi:unnamed protein product [Adineta steineri]|uniref:Uncharacterized protein n=1 Tax=Adineta steineri TaxID=433720 RepID=A0A815LS57_9BILA|nr:unnamed protein product [Adineta steineri]CAF3846340.1 unnamed protein product [Adineta steineri]
MMHEDVDDEEEEVILDRRTLIHQANDSNSLSNSGPILLGVNRFNIKVYDNPIKLSQAKTILLAATSISIGMFTGLLGPTFPFLAQRMPADLSAIIWLIPMKAIGFLIGTLLSAYLYTWFNVCCLLGLSCLAISFGVCSLPLITDLATFYLTSLILGIGLAISYNGIDTLYNRLWNRSTLASVRWLHLLVAVGAILSTLMLFPSAISNQNQNQNLLTTNLTSAHRPRRQAIDEVANRLSSMSMQDNNEDDDEISNNIPNILNSTIFINITSESPPTTTSTTEKVVHKPSVVDSDQLKQSIIVKPTSENKPSDTKSSCIKSLCCYHRNDTNQNETLIKNTFTCKEKDDNKLNDCKDILSTCLTSTSNICLPDKTNIRCRIDQICANEKAPNCTIQSIETAINISSTTTVITIIPIIIITTTTATTTLPTTSTTTLPSTSSSTTTVTTTTTTTTSTTTSTSTTTTTTTTTHHKKPSMAESETDDLDENLFYKKIRSFFQSLTLIHFIYLFLAFTFFLLGIFYSTLAMRGEGINTTSSKPTYLNPLTLLFGNSHRTTNNSNTQISLLSDRSSLKFVFLLLLFYFLLAGIEYSCIYLTYSFGMKLNFSEHQSLIIQFLFFLGLLLGRLIDIFMDYGCFLFNTRITNRTKKQSDKFHLISIKFCILIRLMLLFILCSTLSFSHLFQENSSPPAANSSIPSIQMFYFIFFFIGVLIASIPTLILVWIERDLSLNDSLIQMIFITITISEMIFPSFLFYIIKHVVLSYLFYLFLGSCLLLILFIFILYISKKWQRKKLYRILPTSMEMDDINIENHSDDNDDGGEDHHFLRNERININESKLTLDNERAKGLKGH